MSATRLLAMMIVFGFIAGSVQAQLMVPDNNGHYRWEPPKELSLTQVGYGTLTYQDGRVVPLTAPLTAHAAIQDVHSGKAIFSDDKFVGIQSQAMRGITGLRPDFASSPQVPTFSNPEEWGGMPSSFGRPMNFDPTPAYVPFLSDYAYLLPLILCVKVFLLVLAIAALNFWRAECQAHQITRGELKASQTAYEEVRRELRIYENEYYNRR